MNWAIHTALAATETGLVVPSTALLSVSHKAWVVHFAQDLQRKVEWIHLLSTGGTAIALRGAWIDVQDVSELTGFPEILDGRVKTLQPKVFWGILAARGSKIHTEELRKHDIKPIDIVVVNLYPFSEAIAKSDCTFAQAIENVDIGGPSLIRAAAKNWDGVAVVTDPEDYAKLIECIIKNGGVTRELRLELMKKAFAYTATYDTIIAKYLSDQK